MDAQKLYDLFKSKFDAVGIIETKMTNDYMLKSGRRTLIPGYFDGSSFEPQISFSPGMISPLAVSNSYIIVDENCEILKKDAKVKIIPTRFSFNSKEAVNLINS